MCSWYDVRIPTEQFRTAVLNSTNETCSSPTMIFSNNLLSYN